MGERIDRQRPKRDGVEIYSQERFIICTGNVVGYRPIESRQDMLYTLQSQMGLAETAESDLVEVPEKELDEEVLSRAKKAANSNKFSDLYSSTSDHIWDGKEIKGSYTSLGYPSQSEADIALIEYLCFYSPSNQQVIRMFQKSGLGQREKAKRKDYLENTLKFVRAKLADEAEKDALLVAHGKYIVKNLFWPSSKFFRLLDDNALLMAPKQQWIVKGIIPTCSIGTIFGQSGTFKSFIALDLLAHIANGQPWFENRVKPAPCVYVPFEGKGGIPKRVAAWRARHYGNSSTSTGITYITDPMNLRNKIDRDKLVNSLQHAGLARGVICIDTLAQAGAGIDENSSEGMGEMIAIFQELQQRLNATILVIHHEGKNSAAGMRGWSGLRGALDFAIRCEPNNGDKYNAKFTIDKSKDSEDGLTFNFSMRQVHLGIDEDGDAITSLAVMATLSQGPDLNQAEQDNKDDAFIYELIRELEAKNQSPSQRTLESLLSGIKDEYPITQKRVRESVERLKQQERLTVESEGKHRYLRVN